MEDRYKKPVLRLKKQAPPSEPVKKPEESPLEIEGETPEKLEVSDIPLNKRIRLTRPKGEITYIKTTKKEVAPNIMDERANTNEKVKQLVDEGMIQFEKDLYKKLLKDLE